jgi:REP element-mobilizing transposase RayT
MPEFYNPSGETQKHGVKLPHWQQGEVIQFITFRLADSMPRTKLRQWQEELVVWKTQHPEPWTNETEQEYHRKFTWRLENWLDEGHGACIFTDPDKRDILQRTLMHDQGTKANHHAWVIIPNHIHLLFTPLVPLEKLMQSWKGISARRIGLGSIWQPNYRDTLIRDASHFANAVRYIRRNPAKLKEGTFTLWQSKRAKAI